MGDEVVYLREGHRTCLHNMRDKRPGPWDMVAGPGAAARMRSAEPARVAGLRYAISDDGRRDTARARLCLRTHSSRIPYSAFALAQPAACCV